MYHKVLQVALMALLIFGVVGCSMKPEPIVYPSWYNKPEQDGVNFYGVGKARSEKEAILLAKNMILANILLSISRKDVRYVDIASVKRLAPYIHLEEAKLHQKEELDNGEVVVEVAIGQKVLVAREKERLDALYAKVDMHYKKLDTKAHTLLQFAYLSRYEKEIKLMDYYLSILDVIDPAFKAREYQELIDNFTFTMVDLRMALLVKILSDADALEYIRVIQASFAQNEIVTLISSPDAKESVILKMSTTSQQFESQQFKMVKVKLNFNFLDTKGRPIHTHSVILKGRSTSSYQEAKVDSAHYLEQLIATRGLFEVLGF